MLLFWLLPKRRRHFENLKLHSLNSLHHTRLISLTSKYQHLQLWSYVKGKKRVIVNGQPQSIRANLKRIHKQDRHRYLTNVRLACLQAHSWQLQYRWLSSAGHYLWLEEQGQSWEDGNLAAIAHPVQQATGEDSGNELLFSQTLQACLIFDQSGTIIHKNPAYQAIESRLSPIGRLQDHFQLRPNFWQQLADQGTSNCEQTANLQQGFKHLLDVWQLPNQRYLGLLRNPRMQSLNELNFLSSNHPLTGLPNRQSLHQHLQKLTHERSFAADRLAVIMVNLDHFGDVNSLYGQQGGDELLIQVGHRLSGLASPITLVCHLGGDEFALLAEDFHDIGKLRLAGENILNLFRQDFILGHRALLITASIGIATINQSQLSHSLARGHDALKSARQAGGNCLRLLQQDISDIATNALQFEQDLRQAIANHRLELMFQPKFDIQSGHIMGAEALLRWPHPEKGLLSAGAFIDLAENSGLIRDLGLQVIEMACLSQVALFAAKHHCPIAINLSSKQLVDDGLPDYILSRLQHYRLPCELMAIELTETSLVDSMQSTSIMLERFAELGIEVALDDFGSGYASFKYLAELPFSCLKIDRSFIHPMLENPRMRDLVAIMIDMAHSMELSVVAEGIEHEAQFTLLRELGCDYAQGFHLGRPMPLSELMLRLDHQERQGHKVSAFPLRSASL